MTRPDARSANINIDDVMTRDNDKSNDNNNTPAQSLGNGNNCAEKYLIFVSDRIFCR